MIDQAGSSLRSVRAIVEMMAQQNSAISRIDAGVDEMKSASDRIARGFDEQVKANREFDRSMAAREEQVQAIAEATRFQMKTVERIFSHFGRSEERLYGNAQKARIIIDEINALETLAQQLRKLASSFEGNVVEKPAPAAVKKDEKKVAPEADTTAPEETTEESSAETPQAGQ